MVTKTETPSRWRSLADADPEVARALADERHRQNSGLELIASENVVSQAGATFRMTEAQIRRVISDLGYAPRRRNMYYELLPES